MKKIWTLLVAAITVLAVLTSGCGSSDKAAKPADGKKTTTIGFSISTLNNPFSSYPYVKALKKKQKNSESMLKSSMRKTIPQNRPMIFLT